MLPTHSLLLYSMYYKWQRLKLGKNHWVKCVQLEKKWRNRPRENYSGQVHVNTM